jgi:hypothetical protein
MPGGTFGIGYASYFEGYLPRTIVSVASVMLVFANILMYRKLRHTSN